jgi:hypothetical protein
MKRHPSPTVPKTLKPVGPLLNQSAVLFLILCIWAGPDRAVFLIALVALVVGWFAFCRRWPLVAWGVLGFIRGLAGR